MLSRRLCLKSKFCQKRNRLSRIFAKKEWALVDFLRERSGSRSNFRVCGKSDFVSHSTVILVNIQNFNYQNDIGNYFTPTPFLELILPGLQLLNL